jgi:hypothetical protein
MNTSKPLVLCFLTTAWVFAQAPQVQVTPPQVQVQAPTPTAPAKASAPAQVQAAPPQAQVQTPAPAAPAQVQVAPQQVQFQVPAVPAPAAPAAGEYQVLTEGAYYQETAEIAAPLPPAPSSSSAAEKPADKTIFDSVRGNAYNPYGTVGAPSTVGDLVKTPSDIFGQKFLYVSPSDRNGYTAFDFAGGSGLLGLSNSAAGPGHLSALILGYANSAFGLALRYSVNKDFISNDNTNLSVRKTYPADNISLYLSLPLGSETLYANGGWVTYNTSGTMDIDGDKSKIDYSSITANTGFLGSLGSLNYDLHLNFVREGGSYVSVDNKKAVDSATYSQFEVGIDLGYSALQSKNARVIVGLNNSLDITFYDKIGKLYKGDNIISAWLAPNILGDVAITENFFVFAGAVNSMDFSFGDGDAESDSHHTSIKSSYGTSAFIGIRYQKPNWAIESEVLNANPFAAFRGENILVNLGGFIYF